MKTWKAGGVKAARCHQQEKPLKGKKTKWQDKNLAVGVHVGNPSKCAHVHVFEPASAFM